MAVETTRWGIIYCPKNSISPKHKRWARIRAELDARGIGYDFVQSENQGSVERLTSMLISNGYKTIIIMGGDSALNDAVNCLMKEEKRVRDEIAIGVIPNGVMNDFARFWGLTDSDDAAIVQQLARRRLRRIDLGCIRYTNKNHERCHRYFLNCVNIGMTADIMNLRRQTRRLFGSRTLSFVSSLLIMAFHRNSYHMRLTVNADTIDRQVMTVCVGNARGYGQTPSAVPYNGSLDVSVVYSPKMLQLLSGLWLLVTGRFLNHSSVHPYRTSQLTVSDAPKAMVGVDGRLMKTPVGQYGIMVEHEVVNFIAPS